MEDFSLEELAQLHQKLEGWMGQRTHDPKRPQRRPWMMKPNTASPV
jgi:hypothetical protein